MYITIPSMKKTLGKFVELDDLLVGLPILFIFLILFSFTPWKLFSVCFLVLGVLMMLPVQIGKANRMYKVFILLINYMKRKRNFVLVKKGKENLNYGTGIIEQLSTKVGLK